MPGERGRRGGAMVVESADWGPSMTPPAEARMTHDGRCEKGGRHSCYCLAAFIAQANASPWYTVGLTISREQRLSNTSLCLKKLRSEMERIITS